ncbi:MAG: 5'-nucleotidase C-terminal domain-containing protein [Flavobacteriales bacterium]|nr:5'-nucleotidase C-terminal domain-containing protein [Flavobacteriales bacterium]
MRPLGFIFLLLSLGCKYHSGDFRVRENALVRLDSSYRHVDSEIVKIISPYNEKIHDKMEEVVAFSDMEMRNGRPEGLLGNMICDVFFDYIRSAMFPKEAMCVVMNGGGLRANLPEGDVHVRNVFEILPFENELVICKLTRSQMDTLVDLILKKGGEPVSNLKISKSDSNTKWSLTMGEPDDTYIYVVTSDYLAAGNSGFKILLHASEVIRTGYNLRDVVILQFKNYRHLNQHLTETIEGRIVYE